MAQVRYFKAQITLNELAKHTVEVPEWEIGPLQAQWGDNIQVIEDDTSPFIVERDLPDARDEFERLAQRYGPRHEETPYIAAVYGSFGPGINALQAAIARSAQNIPAPDAGVEPVGADDAEGGDPDDDFADLAGDDTGDAEPSA